jgi:type II secretory pathway predicted ATPase ExeA
VYEEHFGLEQRPFLETVSPAAYVSLPSHDVALRRLRYGLEHNHGPAVLFGPHGSGKTLLTRRLAIELGVTPVHLTFPAMASAELLAILDEEFTGASPEAPTTASSLRRLRDHFTASVKTGRRPLLIVDDAHLIDDPSSFEVLRLLLNFASAGPPDLALLLVGTAELLLQLPPSLMDRLTARATLAPLTASESVQYVQGRLAAAGANTPLFTTEALASLHHKADGLPRRLSYLADLALLIAYAEGHSQADSRTIAIAAREFELDLLAA